MQLPVCMLRLACTCACASSSEAEAPQTIAAPATADACTTAVGKAEELWLRRHEEHTAATCKVLCIAMPSCLSQRKL